MGCEQALKVLVRRVSAVALVVMALLATPHADGLDLGAPAAALERKTASLPQIWYATTSPMLRSSRKWPANDYARLFDPAADAEWQVTGSRLDVLLMGSFPLRTTSDQDLRLVIDGLRRRNISLAMNAHMVEHDPSCGGGEGYAPNAILVARQLERIKALGGTVDYISMDEPLIRGHLLKNLGGGRTGCQYAIADVARRVRANVAAIRRVFPNIQIGSTEAINPHFTGKGPGWAESIRQWAEAFRAETGRPLAFTLVAAEYRVPGWEPALKAWVAHAKRLGIPTGVIYTGGGGQSDQAWAATAIKAFEETERAAGVQPELAAIMSWNQWPNFNLPETKPGTLTNVLLEYLRFRGAVRN